MFPIAEVLVVLAFCVLVGINNIFVGIYTCLTYLSKAILFMFSRMFRKAYTMKSDRISFVDRLRSKQAKAEASANPATPSVQPTEIPQFECAKIHTRKYRNDRVRAILFQYGDTFKRTVVIKERKGLVRKTLEPLFQVSLEEAWRLTRPEAIALLPETKKPEAAQQSQAVTASTTPVETSQPAIVSAPAVTAVETVKDAPSVINTRAEKLARPVEWVGRIVAMGRVKREDVPKPYTQYRIRLQSEMGTEENVWGADLSRVAEESGVQPGESVHIRFLGKRPVPVQEGDSTVTKMKNIYEIARI